MDSPTRNFRVNLTLVGNYHVSKNVGHEWGTSLYRHICLTFSERPSKPVIYDAQGREVTGVGGPFLEGYSLALTCQVSGGIKSYLVKFYHQCAHSHHSLFRFILSYL